MCVSPSEEMTRVEMQHTDASLIRHAKHSTTLNTSGSQEGMTYEQYIFIFILFYGSFWYVLKLHTDDEQDL